MAFRDVVGHDSLLRLVGQAVTRDTLPPSLMFVGPDGVGKRLVAVALAQAQNCAAVGSTDTVEADACGTCPICRRIERASFPDVLLLEPGENGSIPIDPVRRAIGQSTYRPFEGRKRVVIVDDADRLVIQAQNALLKTLEEPTDSSQFVLITSRPDLLLPTVTSRCQRLSFGQLSVDEVVEVLERRDGDQLSDARAAAAAAGGSAGRALELASGELAASRAAAVTLLTTVSTARDARGRLEGAKGLVGKGRAGAASRVELKRRLSALTSLLRDVELLAAGSDVKELANADIGDGLEGLVRTYGGGRALKAFAAVDRAQGAVESNVSPKVVADWLALQL
jgi:DNA polymerase-3 subunit delta'